MVLSGQFLERATLIGSAGSQLEGLWHRGEAQPALLICPPHPLHGSSMDSPVCAELAFAVSHKGHATLRFNYRGAGASQGELNADLNLCVADAQAALELLSCNVAHGELALVGYDFGAQVALELAKRSRALTAVALIAPSTTGCDLRELGKLTARGLIVVGEHDESCDRHALASLCQESGDELVVIAEADHVFSRGLTALGRAIVQFVSGERVD